MLQNTPQVVKNLIILNVIMYVVSGLMGDAAVPLLAGTYPGSPFFQPWQVVTHMFMHGDLGHIFFNMFALFMFGSQLERVWGPQRFLTYYVVCGLGAFALHELVVGLQFFSDYGTFFPAAEQFVSPNASPLQKARVMEMVYGRVVGASGAVFGLLLAFGMLFPNTQLMLLFPPIPIRAKYFVMGYGAIELLLALQNSPGDNVAHFAHLGGHDFWVFPVEALAAGSWSFLLSHVG